MTLAAHHVLNLLRFRSGRSLVAFAAIFDPYGGFVDFRVERRKVRR